MERPGSTWTDARLDDFARRVEERFNRVDERFDRVDERLNRLEGRIDGRIDSVNDRIDALQRTMIQVGGGTIAAILATLITVIATQS